MNIKLISIAVAAAIASWTTVAAAREVVVLPGVVTTEGELNGVDTQGTGTLTVDDNQNINLNDDPLGAITSTAANTASVLFNGSSTVTGTSGTALAQLLNISAGVDGETVNFNGPIFAETFTLSGNGVVNFNDDVIAATNFAENGRVNLDADDTLTGAVTTDNANTGVLSLGARSIVVGAVGGPNGLRQIILAGGNATIVGAVQAQNFSLGTSNLLIAGALTKSAGGTIATTLQSNNVYGTITPTGFTSINGGSVTVTPTVTGVLTTGTNFRIIDSSAGSNGATVNVVDTSPLYRFVGIPTDATGSVDIRAELETFESSRANRAGGALFAVNAAPGSDLRTVQNAVFALPDAASINSAFSQLAPNSTSLAAPWVARQTTRQFDDLWIARVDDAPNAHCLNQANETNKPECKNTEYRGNWWFKGFGSRGEQDDSADLNGFETDAAGFMVAYDVALNSQTRVGLGGGYANTDINENHANGKTKIDSYQLSAYVKHSEGPWFVQGGVTAGIDKYDGSRNIVFPGINRTANSDYTGQQYSGIVMLGKHFFVNEVTITPLISLQATHLQVNGYTEKDAGDINLRVDSQDYNFLQSGVGLKAERQISVGNNIMTPEVHAKWLHDFRSTTMEQTTAFSGGGSTFDTRGVHQDRNLYNVGAGLTFLTGKADMNVWSVKGLYDYRWNDSDYTAHQLSLVASLKF